LRLRVNCETSDKGKPPRFFGNWKEKPNEWISRNEKKTNEKERLEKLALLRILFSLSLCIHSCSFECHRTCNESKSWD
jgi:hypothetical protein